MGMWIELWNLKQVYSVHLLETLANRFLLSNDWGQKSVRKSCQIPLSPAESYSVELLLWLVLYSTLCKPPWDSAMHYTDNKFNCKPWVVLMILGFAIAIVARQYGRRNGELGLCMEKILSELRSVVDYRFREHSTRCSLYFPVTQVHNRPFALWFYSWCLLSSLGVWLPRLGIGGGLKPPIQA